MPDRRFTMYADPPPAEEEEVQVGLQPADPMQGYQQGLQRLAQENPMMGLAMHVFGDRGGSQQFGGGNSDPFASMMTPQGGGGPMGGVPPLIARYAQKHGYFDNLGLGGGGGGQPALPEDENSLAYMIAKAKQGGR